MGSMRLRCGTAGVMTTLMRTGQDRRSGRPAYGPREARTREIGWGPICGLHQGQRPPRLHRDGASLHAKTDPMKVARAG